MTGNAGSGKSTLAEKLGAAFDLPATSLDTIVWQPKWNKTPALERDKRIAQLVAEPRWVIEGVSDLVLAEADTVIFLDVPRRTSYLRCAKRNWRYLFRSRPGLPDDCPELRIIPTLTKIIWRFPTHVRPKIMAHIDEHPETSFRVRSAAQLPPTVMGGDDSYTGSS